MFSIRIAAGIALACATPLALAATPGATTNSATNVSATGATLRGTVTANWAATTVSFHFGPSAAYGTTLNATPNQVPWWGSNRAVTAAVSGLTCGTTYYFRVHASNRDGERSGSGLSFTTTACSPPPASVAPTATTGAASAVTTTAATLSGSATPGTASAAVSFDYGTSTAYGSSANATPSSLAANAATTAVNANLSGLACGTTYHFRTRAVSSVGAGVGANQSFATAACSPSPVAPTTTTGSASAMTTTSATLNGNATAGSASATLSFEYGTTTGYGSTRAATPASLAAGGSGAMSAGLTGLACGTTYHFRARATSSVGTANGGNSTFATAACAPPPPPTACSNANVHCVSPTAGANQEYATIQAAVNVAVAGDTVLVFDGNYVGFVANRSGTASAPITIKANGTGAIIDRASSAGEGVRVNNASYVVVEGFTVSGIANMCLAARGASVSSPMRGIVFRDNTVRNCGSGSADDNIYVSQVTDSLIEGNTSSGSVGHGLYLANAGTRNTTVRGNHLHDNALGGLHMNGDSSVGGDGLQKNITIEDNVIHGNAENGINMDGVQASTIRNNVIYDNGRHAVRGYVIDGGAGPRDMTVVNNTLVVRNGNTSVKFTEDGGGHTVFNNVLVNEGTSGGTLIVGHANVKSDRNTFVNGGFSLNGGSSMLTLAQWRALAGAYDPASLVSTSATLFVAPASRDYRLRAGSPAANAGVASFNGHAAPADDIAGVARPLGTAHDHGAYESF